MPTLREKKLLSKYVAGETKRCLSLVKMAFQCVGDQVPQLSLDLMYRALARDVIKGCPYLEFHEDLQKQLTELEEQGKVE
jgi:hypothetical protein